MRRRLPAALGVLLLLTYAAYALLGLRSPGPADKLAQLLLLVPGVLLLAWWASARTGADLARRATGWLSTPRTGRFMAAACLLLLAWSAAVALGPLEGVPKGGDEAAYFFSSKIHARGELAAPAPEVDDPRRFFDFRHFIFQTGRWFIMYTPTHSLLMAPFTAAGLSWLLGCLEAVVSLLGAYMLLRLWAGELRARAGVVVMLLSPFFLLMVPTHMAHNTNLMFTVWALYLLSRAGRENRGALAVAGGLLLGLALSTKPYMVVPLSLFAAAAMVAGAGRRAPRLLALAVLGAIPPVAGMLAANWYYTGSPLRTAYQIARGGSLVGFGPDKAWFPVYGDHAHTPLRGLFNLAKQAGVGSVIMLGWPLLSLVPALAASLRARRDRRVLWLYLPFFLYAGALFIHYCPAIDYGPRHYFTLMPAFALLTVLGLEELAVRARSRWGSRGGSFVALSTAGLFAITLLLYLPEEIALRSGPWQTIDRVPERLAEERAEPPALVFMEASQHGYPNIMSGINATSPFLDGRYVFCLHQTPEEDREMMVAMPDRRPYLFWFDGSRSHLEPWTTELAEELVPARRIAPPGAAAPADQERE